MKWYKRVPWILVLLIAKVLFEHLSKIDPADRQAASRALKESRGIPGRMTPEHRANLRQAAQGVDRMALGRDLLGTVSPLAKRRLSSKDKD